MANIDMQKKMSDEVAKFNVLQKEHQKVVALRQQLDAQLTENNVVKEVGFTFCLLFTSLFALISF